MSAHRLHSDASVALLALFLGISGTGCNNDADKTDGKASTDTNAGSDTASSEEGKEKPDDTGEVAADSASQWPTEPKALILALEERKNLLDLREREVARREDKVARLELEAISKVKELQALRDEVRMTLAELEKKYAVQADKYALQVAQKKAEIAQQEAQREEQERENALLAAEARKARLAQLVATLKGMRAQAGGEMLASMDENEAVEVLSMLAPRLAASLLGAMPADKSAKLAGLLIGTGKSQGETNPSPLDTNPENSATPPSPPGAPATSSPSAQTPLKTGG